MTWQNELQQILRSRALMRKALQGAGIGFIMICIFIIIAGKGKMDYEVWMLLPIIAVTTGGAFGGIYYFLMDQIRNRLNWNKILVTITSMLVYCVILYLSLILALNAVGQWD